MANRTPPPLPNEPPGGFQKIGEPLPMDSPTSDSTGSSSSAQRERALTALRAAAELAPMQGEVTECPVCNGLGAVMVEAPEPGSIYHGRYAICDCRTHAQRTEWLTGSGLPPLFRGLTFDTYRERPGADLLACERTERWVREGEGSLLLWGDFRRMKTGLACAAMVARTLDGERSLFLKSPDLLNELRASFDHAAGGLRPSEILAAVREVPLLVLDDLGAEAIPRDASWLDEVFYRLIDHRHDYLRPMIVTTNLGTSSGEPFVEMAERLHERTVYRLAEMVGSNVICVGGR
jgi:DNA replication protein DnaC